MKKHTSLININNLTKEEKCKKEKEFKALIKEDIKFLKSKFYLFKNKELNDSVFLYIKNTVEFFEKLLKLKTLSLEDFIAIERLFSYELNVSINIISAKIKQQNAKYKTTKESLENINSFEEIKIKNSLMKLESIDENTAKILFTKTEETADYLMNLINSGKVLNGIFDIAETYSIINATKKLYKKNPKSQETKESFYKFFIESKKLYNFLHKIKKI